MLEQSKPSSKGVFPDGHTQAGQDEISRRSSASHRTSNNLTLGTTSFSARQPKNHRLETKEAVTYSWFSRVMFPFLGAGDQHDYLGLREFGIFSSHVFMAFLFLLHLMTVAITWFWSSNSTTALRFDSIILIILIVSNFVSVPPSMLISSKSRPVGFAVVFVSLLDIAFITRLLYMRYYGVTWLHNFWDVVVPSLVHGGLLVLIRYHVLLESRPAIESLPIGANSTPSPGAQFLVLIAGSGGHTTELLKMMRDSEQTDRSRFRRWIVTKGDLRSEAEIMAYEEWRAEKRGGNPSGVWEIKTIRRAREVHQGWLTVPLTTLLCCYDVYKIMRKTYPFSGQGDNPGYPQPIITNGPGSGYIFVLVCFLMRFVGIIPVNRAQSVFIESIARVGTLSMTGKLFYHTNIADFMTVQHWPVARKYKLHCEWMLAARVDKLETGLEKEQED